MFAGDYEEYRGRFLKDILRDMYEHWESDRRWISISFPIEPSDLSSHQLIPSTLEGILGLITGFGNLDELPSDQPPAGKWIDLFTRLSHSVREELLFENLSDQMILLNRLENALEGRDGSATKEFIDRYKNSKTIIEFCVTTFGVNVCYNISGRGRSDFAARHFLLRNHRLNDLDFTIKRLGTPGDLVILP